MRNEKMSWYEKILYGFVMSFTGICVSGSLFVVVAFIYSHITN